MDIQNEEVQQYVVKYTVKEGDHTYTDALYFTAEEWAEATPESIEAEQQRRFQNWLSFLSTPVPELTEEEKAAHLESLKQQQENLAAQIALLTPQE